MLGEALRTASVRWRTAALGAPRDSTRLFSCGLAGRGCVVSVPAAGPPEAGKASFGDTSREVARRAGTAAVASKGRYLSLV